MEGVDANSKSEVSKWMETSNAKSDSSLKMSRRTTDLRAGFRKAKHYIWNTFCSFIGQKYYKKTTE